MDKQAGKASGYNGNSWQMLYVLYLSLNVLKLNIILEFHNNSGQRTAYCWG